jgi:hypothetical protein
MVKDYAKHSSSDPEATHLHKLENELEEIREDLEEDVEESTGQEANPEFEEVVELEDDFHQNADMVAGENVIGITGSYIERIRRASGGFEVDRGIKETLRHEYAHLIDNLFNKEEYEELSVPSLNHINQAPKEAYAIFEDLRVSGDSGYSFPRGLSAVKCWDFLTEVTEEGEIEWIDNEGAEASMSAAHQAGYYAAKTIEEAANKRLGGRKEAENYVRQTLLDITTVDGLFEEVSKAHDTISQPFYIDILEETANEFGGAETKAMEEELSDRIKRYRNGKNVDLTEFYRDKSLLRIYRSEGGTNQERAEVFEETLKNYRRENSEEYSSDNIFIRSNRNDWDGEEEEQYQEWLPD